MSVRIHRAVVVAGLAALPSAILAAPAEAVDPGMETVVVRAERLRAQLEEERRLTPGSVTTVDGAELYQRNTSNLADLLRYVPGVWAESNSGADELFFSSRGSNLDATAYDKNGVKLLQDGLPVTTADGNNHNRVLDPLSARYATIAHGANALAHGASTLGGAIDFTSPTARTSDPLALYATGGSFGQLNGRVTAGLAREKFDALATLEAKNWDGYRDHNSQERTALYANAGWRWSDSVTTRLYATWIENDEDLPGALTSAEVADDPDQASGAALGGDFGKVVETRRVALKTTWNLGADRALDLGLSYEDQSLYHPIVDRIMVDFDGAGPNPPVEVFSLLVDTDHRDAGASLRYRMTAGDHQWLFGANYGDSIVSGGNYQNLHGRPNGLSERVDQAADNLELFAVDRWAFAPGWTLVYGAQFVDGTRDVRTVNADTGAERHPVGDYSSFNPRLGVIFAFSETSEVYASASRLFEAPTNFELEDDVRANESTLDPMHGDVLEVGVRGQAGDSATRWRWDVSAYYARIRDEILSVDDPAAPGNSLSTNVPRTTHAGIEALLGASFPAGAGRIEPLVNFTLNEFTFDSDPLYGSNQLPAAPSFFVHGEVLYRQGAFFAGPTFDLVGKRFADFANTYEVGSHELLGLRAGYSAERWEVFAEARNLLDEEYIATVGVLEEAGPNARVLYPGAPRAVYAGILVKL